MIENNPSSVSSAFEILLEEIEAEIDFVNGVGARAFEGRDNDKAKEALARSDVLTALRDKVARLRSEWEGLAALAEEEEDEETRAARRDLGHLERGQRTPESAYYLPILQVLEHAGGSGKVGEVLDRVGEMMNPILKDLDREPLASDPSNPRWRNAAQWARHSMVQEGLLRADSPRGTWAITERGRARLLERG